MSKGQTITISTDCATVILNGTAIKDFISGGYITIAPMNTDTVRVVGSNGITLIKKRADRKEHSISLSVVRHSDSDVFLNSIVNNDEVVVLDGSIKEKYKKNGIDMISSWVISNGSVTTKPTDAKSNIAGEATSTYVVQCQAEKVE